MRNNQGSSIPTEGDGGLTAQTTEVRHAPTANNDINLIRSPSDFRPGDILLGRGNKHQKWSGNLHFRSLILERQEEYVSIKGDNRTKNAIARQIFDAVLSGSTSSLAAAPAAPAAAPVVVPALKDGRFLKLVEPEVLAQMGVDDGDAENYWQEVPNDVALEKIKMALRQQKKGGTSSKNDDEDDSSEDVSDDESSSSSSSDIDEEEGSDDSDDDDDDDDDDEKRPKSKKQKKAKARSKTKKAKNKTMKKKKPKRRKKRDKSPKGGGGSNASATDGIPLQVSIGGGGGGGLGAVLAGTGTGLPGLAVPSSCTSSCTSSCASHFRIKVSCYFITISICSRIM